MQSPNLTLPYIAAAQAQKHVTHNEAVRALDALVQLSVADRDLAVPPAAPADGVRYLVAAGASGAWSGQDGRIAAFQDGAWAFFAPRPGWLMWVEDEASLFAFDGGAWVGASGGGGGGGVTDHGALTGLADDDHPHYLNEARGDARYSLTGHTHAGVYDPAGTAASAVASHVGAGDPHPQYLTEAEGDTRYAAAGSVPSLNPAALVGVNTTADSTNRLAVSSPASLFNHVGAGHQIKVNKAAPSDTVSLLYQSGFSGRAEMGLAGDDDFHVKVSADGATWHEAIVVNRASGAVSFPNTTLTGGGSGASDWIAHMSGDASAWLPSHAVGPSGAATVSNGVIVANRLYLTPLVLPRGMNVTQLTVRVNAAGAAGTKARLGIYNAAANGSPGTLLVQSAEIPTDAGSQYVTASVSVALDPLKRYFLALVGSGTPAISGAPSNAFGNAPLGFSLSGALPISVGGVYAAYAYAALPADCSGLSIVTGVTQHMPYVFVS